jgi:nucleoside-diphosphate-sugar epimerase
MGRLLVTGAMGHVGLEVVRQAAAAGRPVLAQYRTAFRPAEAEAIAGDVVWAKLDLADGFGLAALAAQHPVEACIHAAAVPNDSLARPAPHAAVLANVGATANLLELARRLGWRRFVTVSTGSVFQTAEDVTRPILEDAPPQPTNFYSTTKRCAELLTTAYRAEGGVPAASVRISWVYGPPLVPRGLDGPRGPIPHFVRDAVAGIPVRHDSGADFAASFTHVSDVAAGLLAAIAAPALRHPIYHLGWGRNLTTREVAEAVRAAVPGAVIEVGPGTAPWTDHTRMRGPLAGERLREDTGFEPRMTLAEGIASFAAWVRAHPETWPASPARGRAAVP